MVGDKRQPICIPAGMSKVVVGRTQDKLPRGPYMVEATDDDNLPCGISVNHTYVSSTKSRQVSLVLLNTNTYNVWIHQPLYAANIWDVELNDWEYKPIFTKDVNSNTVEIKLQQVPPEDSCAEILSYAAETEQKESKTKEKETSKEKDKKPSFSAQPDTKSPQFDFKKELDQLPFELNISEAPLTRKQKAHLIDIIYDHMDVFSLFDGDLGFCDALKHSIPTTTDKPVYLPHHQIPVQLQSEVRKCLDSWLKQGIICPSKSPYDSQVFIVHKKTDEICMCFSFRKLNAISIRDSFHYPVLKKPFKQFRLPFGFPVLTSCRNTCKWLLKKQTFQKLHFVLALAAFMSLHACHLG